MAEEIPSELPDAFVVEVFEVTGLSLRERYSPRRQLVEMMVHMRG